MQKRPDWLPFYLLLSVWKASLRDRPGMVANPYKLMLDVANELCETESLNVREEDRSFVANFFKFGFVGLVLEWIEHGMQEEPEQIVSHVENLIRGTMELALKNAAWK